MTKARQTRPTIQLWQCGGIGLVISFESGVFYSNQTGGYGCLHPEVEGVYIPLVNEVVDQEGKLMEYFTVPKWQGWCNDGIDNETADFIDAVLASSIGNLSRLYRKAVPRESNPATPKNRAIPVPTEGGMSGCRVRIDAPARTVAKKAVWRKARL